MYRLIIPALVLAGCGEAPRNQLHETNGQIIPANGDSENYTWTGYPRHRYSACGRYIELNKPVAVVSSGWGDDPIAIPLRYLEDPQTKEGPPDGSDYHKVVTFEFPSRYRGYGMREWQGLANGQRDVRPLADAISLSDAVALKPDKAYSYRTEFQGVVDGHGVAMTCSPLDFPNAYCDIEVDIGVNQQRFLVRASPMVVPKLDRIVQIGVELFKDTAPSCGPASPQRPVEIKILP